VITMN